VRWGRAGVEAKEKFVATGGGSSHIFVPTAVCIAVEEEATGVPVPGSRGAGEGSYVRDPSFAIRRVKNAGKGVDHCNGRESEEVSKAEDQTGEPKTETKEEAQPP